MGGQQRGQQQRQADDQVARLSPAGIRDATEREQQTQQPQQWPAKLRATARGPFQPECVREIDSVVPESDVSQIPDRAVWQAGEAG